MKPSYEQLEASNDALAAEVVRLREAIKDVMTCHDDCVCRYTRKVLSAALAPAVQPNKDAR